MSYKRILDSIHRNLARSSLATKVAILLRNQCRRIIACHLSEGANAADNGEDWLISVLAPQSLTFADVGANRGDWTQSFLERASSSVKGLLFEPGTAALNLLHQRFDSVNNLEIIDAAVADYVGEALFFEEPDMGVASSLISSWANHSSKEKKCPVTTLETELERRDWDSIDFLKIDCEGYDFKVIQGANNLIENQKIGVIQFEYNSAWAFAGSTLISALNFFKSCEYEVFLLKSLGLYDFDYAIYGEFLEYSNFVAISPRMKPIITPYIRKLV
jgi:FkbM family methyltransferase